MVRQRRTLDPAPRKQLIYQGNAGSCGQKAAIWPGFTSSVARPGLVVVGRLEGRVPALGLGRADVGPGRDGQGPHAGAVRQPLCVDGDRLGRRPPHDVAGGLEGNLARPVGQDLVAEHRFGDSVRVGDGPLQVEHRADRRARRVVVLVGERERLVLRRVGVERISGGRDTWQNSRSPRRSPAWRPRRRRRSRSGTRPRGPASPGARRPAGSRTSCRSPPGRSPAATASRVCSARGTAPRCGCRSVRLVGSYERMGR